MEWSRPGWLLLFAYSLTGVFSAFPAVAGNPVLPDKAPLPPHTDGDNTEKAKAPAPPAVAPVPDRRPQTRQGTGNTAPHPTENPKEHEPPAKASKPAEKPAPSVKEAVGRLEKKPKHKRPPPPPAPAQLACLTDLDRLGVRFTEKPPISDPLGCAIPNPVEVMRLSRSITMKPAATMNCAISDALSRFMTETVSAEAQAIFGSPLVGIEQASAYVCRDRHGSEKISEHAFGNAVDIARFILKDGTVIDVKDYGDTDPKRSQFLAYVRKAACGPFRTVLGPGADPDHSLHFHFDLEPRHSLRPFCQ